MAQDGPDKVSVYRDMDQAGLSLQSRFHFHCHEGLACFNRCCRTPTIILSPYDILRLKQFLGIASGEFLQRYTRRETEEMSNLPLIFLDPFRTGSGCPFLGDAGCLVYSHRPAACRLFPITMGSQLTEQGVVDYYFRRSLDYCQGFATEVEWTLEEWQDNQGFLEYDRGRRPWLEVLLRQGFRGPANARLHDLFAIAAYDLDYFRLMLGVPGFLPDGDLDAETLASLQENDLALLDFSYRYLRSLISEGV
ncbi:MAG: YkgJ family cysteine cluster protein [Thermodesulfobacteriota bacterium]